MGGFGIWANNSLLVRRFQDGRLGQTRDDYEAMYERRPRHWAWP